MKNFRKSVDVSAEHNENVGHWFSKNCTELTSKFKNENSVSAVRFSKTDFGGLETVIHIVSFTVHLPT